MSATLAPPPSRRPAPPWLRDADPRDGIRVRVDGQTTLHTGDLPHPSYRVDVITEDCAVEVACDLALLRFCCLPDPEHRTGLPQPGVRFGWSVEGLLADGSRRRRGAQLWQVLAACCGDREACDAVCEITRWVATEADQHALALRAGDEQARRAGSAWRERSDSLRESLRRARELRRVPVRPLRDEFVRQCARSGLTAGQLARRLGWHWPRHSRRPDTARVLRRLGLLAEPSQGRAAARRERLAAEERELAAAVQAVSASMSYELAVEICRALRLDPADLGCL